MFNMKTAFKIVVILLTLVVGNTKAQSLNLCPELNFPSECVCFEAAITCTGPPGWSHWDIKATFDAISDAINDDEALFQYLYLDGTNLLAPQEIGANAISRLKFLTLYLISNGKFTNVHPDAFPGTYERTRALMIYNHTFTSPSALAELSYKFLTAEIIFIGSGSYLQEIPANLFSADSTRLNFLSFHETGLESIGEFAFSGLRYIVQLVLEGNQLTAESISVDAFTGINPNVLINLMSNERLTHLPEATFKPYLDNVGGTGGLFVGDNIGDSKYFLHCDESADWICTNTERYQQYLMGYRCRELAYSDVFEYCQAKGELKKNNQLNF